MTESHADTTEWTRSASPALPQWSVAEELRCAARHLAVAASELVRDPALRRDVAARHAVAEAIYREQADCSGGGCSCESEGPAVRSPDGRQVSVLELLVSAIRRYGPPLPLRSIDREVVHGAKELLLAFEWSLPNDRGEPGR